MIPMKLFHRIGLARFPWLVALLTLGLLVVARPVRTQEDRVVQELTRALC
jgi:hypothetical protein